MKKTFNIGTRLVAWLLVFVMVLGYVPVSVFAEEETTDTPVVEDTAGESAAVLGDSEKTLLTAQVTVNEQDKGKQSYTVKALDSNGQDVTDNCSFNWTVSNAGPGASDEESSTSTSPVVNGSQTATATITYQGMQLEVNCSGKTVEDTELTASTSEAAAVVGAAYAPEAVTVANGNTDGAVWSYALDAAYFTNGVATTKTEVETQLGTYTLTYKASENEDAVVIAELAINGTISPAAFQSVAIQAVNAETVEGETASPTTILLDETKWFAKDQKVTINATANANLVDAAYLPAAKVNIGNESVDIVWTRNEDAETSAVTFTAEQTVSETSTFEFGDKTVVVGIDKQIPDIADVSAYESSEGTVVCVTYAEGHAVGDSGIGEVKIVADEIEYSTAKNTEIKIIDNTKFVLMGVSAKNIAGVTVVNGAGVPASYGETRSVSEAIVVEFQIPKVGVVDGTTYVKSGVELEVIISNVSENGAAAMTGVVVSYASAEGDKSMTIYGEGANEGSWNGSSYLFSVPVSDGDSNFVVDVTTADANRSGKGEDGRSYAVDTAAPTITISPEENNSETVYYKDERVYEVQIADDYLDLSAIGSEASVSIAYKYAGEEEVVLTDKTEMEIKVGNGQTLEYITVNATDNSGNVADEKTITPNVTVDTVKPVANIDVSDNVAAFYEKKDDNGNVTAVFAQIIPVSEQTNENDPNTQNVTFTVTITDTNLPDEIDEAWGEGWSFDTNGALVKTFSAEVAENKTGIELDIEIPAIKDKAGWIPSEVENAQSIYIAAHGKDNGSALVSTVPMNFSEENGTYSLKLQFDRRAPSSDGTAEVPVVKLESEENDQMENGIYTGNGATFYLTLTDDMGDALGAGIQQVDCSVNPVNQNAVTLVKSWSDEYNCYVLKLNWDEGMTEINNLQIMVNVVDYLGNTYNFTSENYQIDNKKPKITIEFEDKRTDKYINADREATITVSDMNINEDNVAELVSVTATKNGAEFALGVWSVDENNNLVMRCTFAEDGLYTFKVTAKDAAGQTADISYNNAEYEGTFETTFVIDKQDPVINVEATQAEFNTVAGVDYYSDDVTYNFIITDQFMDAVTATATFAGTDGVQELKVNCEGEENNEWDVDTYTTSVTVPNGMILTGIEVKAKDLAGRDNTWNYEGNATAVDTEAPEITVDKIVEKTVGDVVTWDGSVVQTYNGNDYYAGTVTYNVTVKDQFLSGNIGSVEISFEDETLNRTVELVADEANDTVDLLAPDKYTASFSVENGQRLTGIQLKIADDALNTYAKTTVDGETYENLNVGDADELTAFTYDEVESVWKYGGNAVVVDTTAPTVNLKFSDNVASVYKNKATGTVYVELENHLDIYSGEKAENEPETVTLTVTASDLNLATDADIYRVEANNKNVGSEWEFVKGSAGSNADSEVAYVYSVKDVQANQSVAFVYKVTVYDLAGNAVTAENISVGNVKDDGTNDATSFDVDFAVVNENETVAGCITNTVTIDRRPASSIEGDNQAPAVIELIPDVTPTKTESGLDLFNGEFTFSLNVSDAYMAEDDNGNLLVNEEGKNYIDEAKTSGIHKIYYTLNGDGLVESATEAVLYENTKNEYSYKETVTIPVKVNGAVGETNNVVLTVWVIDNAGNTVKYVKTFGFDNYAPRVKVVFDNNSQLNDGYFKEDRCATITVEELNFSSAVNYTNITTNVTYNSWTKVADKTYQVTIPYSTDGEYELAMTCKDLAENKANIDLTNGNTNAFPDKFVIDLTAPVMEVAYSPAVPVDKDDMGVWFFDQDRRMTVTITEKNFRTDAGNFQRLEADLGDRNTLSAWNTTGDVHVATTTFTEGNNYKATINYTDLAGNEAVTYSSETFSVDTHEPTITVSKGDLTTSALNIVQGDLSLAFTINDEQNNLKNVDVTLMHLDNEFNLTEVSGDDYYSTAWTEARTTVVVDFTNIAAEKENDGIYFVRINAQDYAGHNVSLSPEMSISLNRFGSTFKTEDSYTKEFLSSNYDGSIYKQAVTDTLVISEINPNKVWQDSTKTEEGSVITIAVNGESYVLEKGTDYQVEITQEGNGSNKYYVYTYSINPDVFNNADGLVNGQYSLLFYSEDEAGNKNTNETNVDGSIALDGEGNYSGKVSFTLDNQEPVVTVIGIMDDQRIQAAYQRVEITTSDNTPVVGIRVLVDDIQVQQYDSMEGLSDSENWLYYDEESGTYILNLAQKNSRQNISIVATDAAGNEGTRTVENVLISSNGFIQFINNIWLVILALLLLLALIFIIIILIKKRKKDEKQA